MRELTEQEKLAQLVGGDSVEDASMSSADLLTEGLMKKMGGASASALEQVTQEIESSGGAVDQSPVSSFSTQGPKNVRRDEKLINALSVVYGGLVDVFEQSGVESAMNDQLIALIETAGACLNYLGERTDKFEPLKHLSGLGAPDITGKAKMVASTTLNCYSLGEIIGPDIENNGRTIKLAFTGRNSKVSYQATGVITADFWDGSEAIDYIYTPGSGKMSVKAYERGRWIDRSDSGNYDIRWSLAETPIGEDPETSDPETEVSKEEVVIEVEANEVEETSNKVEGNTNPTTNHNTVEGINTVNNEKDSVNKKEVVSDSSNMVFDEEEIGDFPIDTVKDSEHEVK